MMKQVGRFVQLSPAERRLFLKAGGAVVAVRLGLWILPFPRLRRIVAGLARRPEAHPLALCAYPAPQRIVRAVVLVSRYVPAATCLTQAMAAQVLLARYGYTTSLRIGVAKGERGQLLAHAWLESEGRVVIGGSEADLKQYVSLPTLDEASL